MAPIQGFATTAPNKPLALIEFDPGELKPGEVEIVVEHCGLCHSDLSVVNNDWSNTEYPLIPGHEVVGTIAALGEGALGLKVGQRVGLGWFSQSCLHCTECIRGQQHLCPTKTQTIIGHHGGFANRVRAHWEWVIPLPDGMAGNDAGPLMCGGVTVFAPLLVFDVKPTARVGVVGIGGLGHMAIKFYRAWGCEVTAFTSHKSKFDEAKKMGAHQVVSSKDSNAIGKLANSLDFLIIAANVPLDWSAFMSTLAPSGRMHVVGAVLQPIPVAAFDLITGERSFSGSPTGSPNRLALMLEFAARHKVLPQVEHFPMSQVNEALAHLKAGKAHYRIVLDADFKE